MDGHFACGSAGKSQFRRLARRFSIAPSGAAMGGTQMFAATKNARRPFTAAFSSSGGPSHWRAAVGASLIGIVLACGSAFAADAAPIKIAIFDFELEDFSAASTTTPGPLEAKYLAQATEEARRKLAESGRYDVVDTAGADLAAAQGHGLRNCRGCDAAIAAKLGADQDMVGVVTKISMTEYTVTVQVRDARAGAVLNTYTTSLRIGAGYSWPRGVAWLMKNRVLATR
jgi:hypothetical protein